MFANERENKNLSKYISLLVLILFNKKKLKF